MGRVIESTPTADDGQAPPEIDGQATDRADVLLVEDDRANRFVTATILRRQGYRVDVAESGFDAVAMVAGHPYDLVLMDLQMPGIDGFETARRMQASPGRATLPPIVALTASAGPGDRARCRAYGFDDMLRKPVRPADVAALFARDTRPRSPGPSVRPGSGPGATFDLDRLAELRRDLSAPVVADLLMGCLDDLARRLPALRAAADCGDTRAVETAAHAVAGVAGTYGLAALRTRMRRVLDAARAGDLAGIRLDVAGADAELTAAAAAVRAAVAPAAA